ncbi:hypothetical protein KFK14_12775 [Sphingobium phenoxybenzoativorans]|uniref:Uncharacterized protein n=1 Tax=Sphingobium phenoxybenzoativorans TaxID=1592790 RepID=A0A975K326_9SPHN|nr:hypothetical protein [Sphingobium phenoxybenzoativorans]QUT04020.1 hypothetical protein KFK14_12775 [Sphingobium phenoxybenzoativorans]
MATAPIGHNNPPSVKEVALIEVSEALAPMFKRAAELLASAEKASAEDAESAGKCADLVKMIRACTDEIDRKRKEAQKPYDDAIGVMRDAPRKILLDLDNAKRKVAALGAEFDKKERQRLADEQAEKDAQAARDRKALEDRAESLGVELPPEEPKKEPARGKPVKAVQSDMGSSYYERTNDVYTIVDPYALPLEILSHEKVTAAIISVAREMRKGNKDARIKGIAITTETTTVVR